MSCFLLFIVTWVYAPWFFVSSQQRFGLTDIKAPSACHSSQVLDRPCYSSQVSKGPCYSSEKSVLQFNVTALFYSEDSRKIHLWGGRAHRSKDARRRALQCAGERERERERERASFGSSFYMFFLFCFVFVQPGVFTWGPHSGPRTFLCSVFLGLSLLCLLAPPFWTPFPYSTCLTSS